MERDPGDRFESLPERLIREAIEAGEFDDLPGRGRSLAGAGTVDDDIWWVRNWVERNRIDSQSPTRTEQGSSADAVT